MEILTKYSRGDTAFDSQFDCTTCGVKRKATQITRAECDCVIDVQQELLKRPYLHTSNDPIKGEFVWPTCAHTKYLTQEEMCLIWGSQGITLGLENAGLAVPSNCRLTYLYISPKNNSTILSNLQNYTTIIAQVQHLVMNSMAIQASNVASLVKLVSLSRDLKSICLRNATDELYRGQPSSGCRTSYAVASYPAMPLTHYTQYWSNQMIDMHRVE